MSAKRGDRVAPPPDPGEWDVVFGTNVAAKGWEDLCAQAASKTRDAWQIMRTSPTPAASTGRHHRLKGTYATGTYRGRTLPQWQIEVTAGGRIWYLVDDENTRVVVMYAKPAPPQGNRLSAPA